MANKFIKILIIEDELTSSKTLNSFLHTVGEIDIAVNGNKALTAVKKALENNQPYDLIFLDIMLPELDGITVLKKIRQFESQHGVNEHARAKIIMTSANTDKNIILKAARADCTAYLIKPIDKTRLYNEIRKHGFGNSE